MKRFNPWNVLAAIAIIENTVAMIAQGGIWIPLGLIFGGTWGWIWYWDRHWKRRKEVENLITMSHFLDFATFSIRLRETGVTVREFNQAIASMSIGQKQFIGDIRCRNNARNPYIRCAVNPCGPCEGCSNHEII